MLKICVAYDVRCSTVRKPVNYLYKQVHIYIYIYSRLNVLDYKDGCVRCDTLVHYIVINSLEYENRF